MTGSLAYRKNEAEILEGRVPDKYTRILPYVPIGRVTEIGSAEGVLSMLMAKQGCDVAALELSRSRHEAALALRDKWVKSDPRLSGVRFFNGNASDNLFLFNQTDTLVAVRMIYYLRDQLDEVFAAAAKVIPNVVLCGNGNRAKRYREGVVDAEGGPVGYYASAEGMRALLERHGYTIVRELLEGDEIVVGRKDA